MKCPVCNHENANARFCEKCGSNLAPGEPLTETRKMDERLEPAAAAESGYTHWSSTQEPFSASPSSSPSVSTQPSASGDKDNNQWSNVLQNEKVQQAKEVSKQYLSYFLIVMARPYQTMKTVGEQHALNGLLTMALVILLVSLFFLQTFSAYNFSSLFLGGFVRPLIFTAVTLAAALVLIYAVLKMEKLAFHAKTLVAQFGSLLVPAAASLIVANVFVFISFSIAFYLFVVSYIIIFVALNAVLFHYPLNRSAAAMDSLYSVLIANVVLFYIMYRLLAATIFGMIGMLF